MGKTTKKWIIAAVALVGVSAVTFAGAVISVGGDFTKFDLTKYQEKTYVITENFEKVSIKMSLGIDVVFARSDGECRVDTWVADKIDYDVSVKDGALEIQARDKRFWYEKLFDFSVDRKMTVYLPKLEYEAVTVSANTSDIKLPNDFTLGSLDITTDTGDVACAATVLDSVKIVTDTGDIEFNSISSVETANFKTDTGDISVKNLKSAKDCSLTVDTGDVYLENVIVGGKLTVNSDTGDVKLEKCDADTIFIATDTGDVKGSLLTEKVFIARSNTGDVIVPETVVGGKCEIKSDTGDVIITLANA